MGTDTVSFIWVDKIHIIRKTWQTEPEKGSNDAKTKQASFICMVVTSVVIPVEEKILEIDFIGEMITT